MNADTRTKSSQQIVVGVGTSKRSLHREACKDMIMTKVYDIHVSEGEANEQSKGSR